MKICDKFLELNVLFDKLVQPEARIYPEDLECLDFKEFKGVPPYESLLDDFLNLAGQAAEIFVAPEGSNWRTYEEKREFLKKINPLIDQIAKTLRGQISPNMFAAKK